MPYNKGKRRYWTCAHCEHYYDDFVNTHLCKHVHALNNECLFRGNLYRMHLCPLFERGSWSKYGNVG